MGHRSLAWVNTPVLLQALERYEQGGLPRSMQLWIQQLLELPPTRPSQRSDRAPGAGAEPRSPEQASLEQPPFEQGPFEQGPFEQPLLRRPCA